MKKILFLMLVLFSVFAFVSCGCQETPDDPEDEGTSEGAIEDNPLPLIPVKPVQ